jgi:hypothetical protein
MELCLDNKTLEILKETKNSDEIINNLEIERTRDAEIRLTTIVKAWIKRNSPSAHHDL